MDTGLLIIRLFIGLLFVGHGTQKLLGWFGGHGLEGTGKFFEGLGYRPGKPFAAMAGLSEAGGGLLLAAGLLTPLAAAVIIGVMVNAIAAAHWENGLWVTDGGYEFPLTNAVVALAVACTGPGSVSVDHALGWHLAGIEWGLAAVLIGSFTAAVPLMARNRDGAEDAEDAEDTRAESKAA
jgi:putative oxidoreductase